MLSTLRPGHVSDCEFAFWQTHRLETNSYRRLENVVINVLKNMLDKEYEKVITLDDIEHSALNTEGRKERLESTGTFYTKLGLDFSNDALQAAEKGMSKLLNATTTLQSLKASTKSTVDINTLEENCYKAMNDDFNTPILIAHLFEAVRIVNSAKAGDVLLKKEDIQQLNKLFEIFVFNILGLQKDQDTKGNDLTNEVMDIILQLRRNAKDNKDWTTADLIRDELKKLNIEVRDGSDGSSWELKN